MAAFLQAQGWEPGSRIAILSRNCAWWIMADLAIWMAGHVTVPIFPSLRGETVRFILEHSDSKACFVGAIEPETATWAGLMPGMRCICFPTARAGCEPGWDALVSANPPISGNPVREAAEPATIIYTSGTTGLPKGVVHSFGAIAYNASGLSAILSLTPEDRVLSYLPLAHIVERIGLECGALCNGFRVFFTEGLETFMADLHRARPTIFLSVPRLLLKFQQGVYENTPREKLDKLLRLALVRRFVRKLILKRLGLGMVRFAASGAAPLSPELLKWYRDLGLELAEGYGMTEILITHLGRPGHVRAGCVGTPLEGVEARTGDEKELLIRSPMNMLRYHKDPESTRNAFTPDGFFRTGDVVNIDADGQLCIVGRLKEQFKTSKGKYVAPAPIENKLIAHPDVESVCLMGAGQPSPFAIVLLSAEARKQCADPARRKSLEQSLR
ncbi:MAG: AMP-binding protein, partial [Acidobacteria bacterium]|nr:AMP-binding protein [Acidobacteriota bacterium]